MWGVHKGALGPRWWIDLGKECSDDLRAVLAQRTHTRCFGRWSRACTALRGRYRGRSPPIRRSRARVRCHLHNRSRIRKLHTWHRSWWCQGRSRGCLVRIGSMGSRCLDCLGWRRYRVRRSRIRGRSWRCPMRLRGILAGTQSRARKVSRGCCRGQRCRCRMAWVRYRHP